MRTSLPFALIFSLVLSSSPTNAQDATSEGSHISAPFLRSAQTLDGQPLWTLAPAAHFSAQDAHDGEIRGVVVTDGTGQPLTNQRIELRRPTRSERLLTTTDASGSFVYHGLSPGRYEIELREEGRAIVTSGPLELFEGNMQIRDVKMVRPASDWARVVALTPQTDVVVAARGSKPTRRRIVRADQSSVTVNIVKPVVNVVTRTEVIAREDIVEVRTTERLSGKRRALGLLGGIGGAFAGSFVGAWIGSMGSSGEDLSGVALGGGAGLFGGAILGYRTVTRVKGDLIYRAPPRDPRVTPDSPKRLHRSAAAVTERLVVGRCM